MNRGGLWGKIVIMGGILNMSFFCLTAAGAEPAAQDACKGLTLSVHISQLGKEFPPEKVALKTALPPVKDGGKPRFTTHPRLKKIDDDAHIWFNVSSSLKIFDYDELKKVYKEGKSASTLPKPDSKPFLLQAFYQKESPVDLLTLWIQGPKADTICGADIFPLTAPITAGAECLLRGQFFGTSAPKVWLEYVTNKGAFRKLTCAARRPFLFPNAYGTEFKQPMAPFSGESALIIRMPSRFPKDFKHGDSVLLVLDNGISIDSRFIATTNTPVIDDLKVPDENLILDQALWDDAKGSVTLPILTAKDKNGKFLVRDESGARLTLRDPRSSVPGVAEYSIKNGDLKVIFKPKTGGVTTHIYVYVTDAKSKREKRLRFPLRSNRPYKYPVAMNAFLGGLSHLRSQTGSAGIFAAHCEGDNYYFADGSGTLSVPDTRRISDETLFQMGSMTELYTATAALYLYQSKKFNINKKVTYYLKDFKMNGDLVIDKKRSAKLTPGMLLSHTSGLTGYYGPGYFSRGPENEGYIDSAFDQLRYFRQLTYDPGEIAAYSPDNYVLLEQTLNAFTLKKLKCTYDDYFFNVFAPKYAKLRNTAPPFPGLEQLREVAQGFSSPDSLVVQPLLYGGNRAANYYYSTPVDLCQIGKTYMPTAKKTGTVPFFGIEYTISGFKGLLKNKYVKLSKKNWAVQETKFHPINDLDKRNGFGLGWDSVKNPVFDKFGYTVCVKRGSSPDCGSVLLMCQELKTAIAISMSAPYDLNKLETLAENYLLESLIERKTIKADDKKLTPLTRERGTLSSIGDEQAKNHTGLFANATNLYAFHNINGTPRFTLQEWRDSALVQSRVLQFRAKSNRLAPDALDAPEYYAKKSNNDCYMVEYTIDGNRGIAENHALFAQRLPEVKFETADQAAWDARNGQTWMIVNDPCLSSDDEFGGFITVRTDAGFAKGYVGLRSSSGNIMTLSISSPNLLQPNLKIPGKYGAAFRTVLLVRTQDGYDALRIGEWIAHPVTDMDTLQTGTKITVAPNGFTQGRRLPVGSAKLNTIDVQPLQKGCRVRVFDADFKCVWDKSDLPANQMTSISNLPEGGYIQFKSPSARAQFGVY